MAFNPKGSKVTGPMRVTKSKGAPQGVVAKRAANNGAKGRFGLKNQVADNDPMASRSNANYP